MAFSVVMLTSETGSNLLTELFWFVLPHRRNSCFVLYFEFTQKNNFFFFLNLFECIKNNLSNRCLVHFSEVCTALSENMLSYLVQDYSNSIDKYVICSKCLKKCEKRYKLDDPDKNSFRFLSVDSVELNRFLLDLRCFPLYRLPIANFINDLWTSNHQRLVLKIHPPLKEPIDYAW